MKTTSNSRRRFLKTASLSTAAVAIGVPNAFSNEVMTPQVPLRKGSKLILSPDPDNKIFKPLDEITVSGFKSGTLNIIDGNGNLFLSQKVEGGAFTFRVGGALGIQTILLLNKKQELEDWASYKIDAKTEINDKGERYQKLLKTLYWSMVGEWGATDIMRYNGEFFEFFVCWLRDHVHTMKGMKYFYPNLKSAIDLYAKYQKPNGMIYDNIYKREMGGRPNYWEKRFDVGVFMEISDDNLYELKRIPVENDVEYLFLEGLYYTWKATGDTEWMKGKLDKALKAVEYSTTDPYRWSEKFQLLKRGYTIDTWDFQSRFDLSVVGGDIMVVDREKTRFGVMHGDNTGMAAGLVYLAEMLDVAGRTDDALKMRQLGKVIRERLDKLSWNGSFFRHHISEKPEFVRDTGTDPETQVSLSNSYALNRGITHEQAVAIIKTYQRIRGEMPKSSPGEWFTIYPPYETGFEGHSEKWDYMNGGVITITAGELAHGAFEHGYEDYGVDILNRVADLALTTNDYLHCTYRGAMPDKPVRNFTTLSLAKIANGDIRGEGHKDGVPGWFSNDPKNDFRNLPTGIHSYQDVPFDVVDPSENKSKSCLLLSDKGEGFYELCSLPVNKKATSIYFLHTCAKNMNVGTITLEYADGSTAIDYIDGSKIHEWYLPADKKSDNCRLGWWGANGNFTNVGCMVYGYNNPNPDKEIKNIRFNAFRNRSVWGVLGVTLCDCPVFFMPGTVSFGIPDNWGAGAVTYALIEGLSGVKDDGVSFDKVRFAPRWEAAKVTDADVTIKYESSGGYVSYKYRKKSDEINIFITGNGNVLNAEILLPASNIVNSVTVNGNVQPFSIKKVENSSYCCFDINGNSVKDIRIALG